MTLNKVAFSFEDFAGKGNEVLDTEYLATVTFFNDDNGEVLSKSKRYFQNNELKFKNCRLQQGFSISLNPVDFQTETIIKLVFESCFINNVDKKFKNIIKIEENSSVKFELVFVNCVITDLELNNCSFRALSVIQSIMYEGRLAVRDCKIPSITVSNSLGSFFINDCRDTNLGLSFHDHSLVLEPKPINKLIKDITKKEGLDKIFELKGYFNISDVKNTNVEFQKNNKAGVKRESTPIGAGQFKKEYKYFLTQEEISKLKLIFNFTYSDSITAKLTIKDAEAESLQINGKSDSVIKLDNIKTNSFYLHNFDTKETHLFNLKPRGTDSKFEAKDSDLSKVWFNKVSLRSFSLVNFYKTTLEDIRFTSTEFPKTIESLPNIHCPKLKNEDFHFEQYENYRQLKKTLLDQGNIVQALDMHGKMYDAIEKDKNLALQDKLILFLNRYSNKHATSIGRAAAIFVILAFSLHYLNMTALPEAPYYWGWDGFDYFLDAIKNTLRFSWENLERLFVIINPAHRISELNINEVHSLSTGNYAVSFMSRILIAWIYYQFIMAFRKFGKH